MNRVACFGALAIVTFVVPGLVKPGLAETQSKPTLSKAQMSPIKKIHRVVLQVSQNDPALMTTALNNAENLVVYYRKKGETVKVEFVAYGPGLHMLRSDTSPVKDRLKGIAESLKEVTFSGCGNTLTSQGKQESKEITLAPEARIVPSGIARIADLAEQGWTYIRP